MKEILFFVVAEDSRLVFQTRKPLKDAAFDLLIKRLIFILISVSPRQFRRR